ncbi:MAG: hypothetical protein K8U03_07740 [Planctomycetia bacterium]|nr:hypothetical protein [Planctomycetia bacterium]
MNSAVEELIERWRLRELPEAEVLFITGAGISNPPPTSFPLGNPLHRLLVSNFSSLTQGEIGALLPPLNNWALEQTCDVIFEECQTWQPNADVNWFWNLLSEIFIYDSGKAWMQPNEFHAYFRRHIERGGTHFTANLDQFIELNSMPYRVLTTCELESTDVPLDVGNLIGEPKIYKFHGDCNIDAVHLQGVLHQVIRDGFQANTKHYWSEVLRSVNLVCICGYGGFDGYDVNRFFEELEERHFEAKAVWISYASNTQLEIIPNSQLHQSASMILSRFAESVVIRGESDELLNVLFPNSGPRIKRLPSTEFAPEYENIFRVNIQKARIIPGFQGCLDNITKRLRATVHAMYTLTPAEHDKARLIAYFIAEARGGGRLPPYNPDSASDDFHRAAGQVIADRT